MVYSTIYWKSIVKRKKKRKNKQILTSFLIIQAVFISFSLVTRQISYEQSAQQGVTGEGGRNTERLVQKSRESLPWIKPQFHSKIHCKTSRVITGIIIIIIIIIIIFITGIISTIRASVSFQ